MQRAIDTAKVLSKHPEQNHIEYLKDCNLFNTFEGIYRLNISASNANLISAYLIYAYDPDSVKLDIRKDRIENKSEIMNSIGINPDDELMQEIITNGNDDFNNCVLLFLEKLTDWRWVTIYSLLDYHANMIRFSNQKTESEKKFDKMNKEGEVKEMIQEYDIDTISKVNIQKSDLLKRAIDSREKADVLLDEIRKNFLPTDTAVQADLGFVFTETAKKKVNVSSWREFIRNRNDKKLAAL